MDEKPIIVLQWLARLESLRTAPAVFFIVLSLVSVAALDFWTGPEFAFSLFYFVSVALTAIVLGLIPGLAMSLLTALLWTGVALLEDTRFNSFWGLAWSVAVRTLNLSLVAFLLHQLQMVIGELRRQSLVDRLTGAPNRRYFEEFLSRVLKEARRDPSPLTVAFLDIDDFKAINDTQGHDAGDEVLQAVASGVRSRIRPGDLFARLGGDEFVLVLPRTTFDQAADILPRAFSSLPVGVSVGAVTFDDPPGSVEAVLDAADGGMYAVKKSGKGAIGHTRASLVPLLH